MKFIFSILLLSSLSAYSEEMYSERDLLNDFKAPFPPRAQLLDIKLEGYKHDCTGNCSTTNIIDVFKLRNKYFLEINEASEKYHKMSDFDKAKPFAKLEYYEATAKFLEAESQIKTLQIENLKKKAAEAEAKCAPNPAKDDSLTVNDSNRSFFNKISDIFSWKRETPAPVEDRSFGTSK